MEFFSQYKVLTTLIFILLAYGVKIYAGKWLKKRGESKQQDTRYVVNSTRNLVNLVLLVVLLYLWRGEIQQFAFSIAAFVVAIVLATREYIQCFIGFLYVTSTSPFRVGDWVQTNHHTGEVAATDWAKLTLLEIDPESYSYTGKTLFVPNSQLITQPIKNLNFLKRYVSHSFTITVSSSVAPFEIKDKVLEKAQQVCADFREVAQRYNALIEKRLEVSLPGPDPSVSVTTTEMGRIKTSVTVFCPTEQALVIEEALTRYFFSIWQPGKDIPKEES